MANLLPNAAQLLKIETSLGDIYFRAASLTHSFGSLEGPTGFAFVQGGTLLYKLYEADNYHLKFVGDRWWLKVSLRDGFYGIPEYRVFFVDSVEKSSTEEVELKIRIWVDEVPEEKIRKDLPQGVELISLHGCCLTLKCPYDKIDATLEVLRNLPKNSELQITYWGYHDLNEDE